MPLKEKKAHYRRCFLTDGNGKNIAGDQTLQSALAGAVKTVRAPWLKSVGISGTFFHLLTETQTHNSCLCGEIVFFEKGRQIPLVDVASTGEVWRGTIQPKDTEGIERKVQEQALFFAIRDNHVAIIQSTQLDIGVLLTFLMWLIQREAKILPNAFLDLQNMPAREAREKLKEHEIRAIRFGEPLYEKVTTALPEEPGQPPRKRRKLLHEIKTNSFPSDLLGRMGVAQPIIDKIAKNRDPGSIQVDIQISYRSRSEKEAASILQGLAQTIGTRPELNPEIILSNDSKITTDELTLIGDVHLNYEGGRAGADDAFKKLSQWLAEQIQGKRV